MELFLLNLVYRVSKPDIDPVEDVEHSHTWHQQIHINIPSRDNVNRQETLQLHYVLMEHCCWECRKELHYQIMGLDVFDIPFILICRDTSDFKEVLNDHDGDILSVVVTKLIIVHEHE